MYENGRGTYTEEIAEKICDLLAEGRSMNKACAELGLCKKTVYNWLTYIPEFAVMTVAARDQWADTMFDQLIEISSDETIDVKRARLITDSMKWYMGKQRPNKYNEKFLLEHIGNAAAPVAVKVVFVDAEKNEADEGQEK